MLSNGICRISSLQVHRFISLKALVTTFWWNNAQSINITAWNVLASKKKNVRHNLSACYFVLVINRTHCSGFCSCFSILCWAGFRQSYSCYISIMAQRIETQLMPNESLGRYILKMVGHFLRQVVPSWRNLRQKVFVIPSFSLLTPWQRFGQRLFHHIGKTAYIISMKLHMSISK